MLYSVTFLLWMQNYDLWAQSWVLGRAGSCIECDLDNIVAGQWLEFGSSPKPMLWWRCDKENCHTRAVLTVLLWECSEPICMICQFCLLSVQVSHIDLVSQLCKLGPHFLCSLMFLAFGCTSHLLMIHDQLNQLYRLYTTDFFKCFISIYCIESYKSFCCWFL